MKNLIFIFYFVAASMVQINAQTEDTSNSAFLKTFDRDSAVAEARQSDFPGESVPIDYDRTTAMERFKGYLHETNLNSQTEDPEELAVFEKPEIFSGESESGEPLGDIPPIPKQNSYVRPTKKERFDRYVNKMVGTGLISVGFSAVLNQINNEPEEWEKNAGGFGRRLASAFGQKVIKETIAFGIEESLKLDSKFYKSEKRDVGSRITHGLLSGFTARRPSGKKVFNPGPIVGSYTSNVIAKEAWYPERYSYHDGIRSATRGLAFTALFGLVNEFVFN